MPYTFREDIAIADVAFEASGKTIEEMFESAGLATTNTMVKDLKSVTQAQERIFKIKAKDSEQLLHGFLQEIIYYKDAKLLLFSKYELKILHEAGGLRLEAKCKGGKIDMKKQELLVDVKAVSWHMFRVWEDKKAKEWKSFVILDV